MKSCRFLMLHPETNPGKIAALEALLKEYVAYVRVCADLMLERHIPHVKRKDKQAFFPPADRLSSQIEKNARDHAIAIVSGWFVSIYDRKVRPEISRRKKVGELDEVSAKALYTIGKYLKHEPNAVVTQEHLDAYWDLLGKLVKRPEITDRIGMRLSEMTSRLEDPDEAALADLWLRISTLESRKSLWLPVVGSPYVRKADDVGKGILVRKTKRGRWRLEVLDVKTWDVPELPVDAPKVGVDVGLNVVVATSDGRLYGADLKPKFDRCYEQVRKLRANRQRQGLKENSARLDRLESKLTGLCRTACGQVMNQLLRDYPGFRFVLEDLDLSGCRGSKRFCYRMVDTVLQRRAHVEHVNPAYTSQECPSCGYISRLNRDGVKFRCRSCGRKAHADYVGASAFSDVLGTKASGAQITGPA